MNLRDQILLEHSKANVLHIAQWIGNNPKRYAQLATIFLEGDYRVSQRAAWILSHSADQHPLLILPHLKKFLAFAVNPPHVAVKRNVLRVMTLIDIPEDLEGEVYDLCFGIVQNHEEDIGVRAYAISIIGAIALKYEELKSEVRALLISFQEHASPALRSRSKKVLKELE